MYSLHSALPYMALQKVTLKFLYLLFLDFQTSLNLFTQTVIVLTQRTGPETLLKICTIRDVYVCKAVTVPLTYIAIIWGKLENLQHSTQYAPFSMDL